ncbi:MULTISPECIES: glycoside hydrolase family 15 protein [Haloarcula]|uniref:Glucan 1,4-alpha-glucosidase n=1 Tax=Haloarcula pellucida TaxID=1427151 RepID=A0A830GQ82_9EURY|nr:MULTISPECIES: glycoside hydrolase family 15 protein [Halomicroarcula]MBX0348990.1 glucoamylase [Halomicroarcula pellucida]MDS0279430.1 glycoside hydrolase family 15 protein [Halomicroarcula sp. S1AR25-4]GGN98509.1 glucan 1,4-alpha-glucosidase [Halomicroarcula pellucida]
MTQREVPTATADATWTVGEKYGFGTVCDHDDVDPSRVWYTLTEGAVTEVRFPRIDVMNVRELDFLITDGEGYAVRTFRERRDLPDTVERSAEAVGEDALLFRQTARPTDDHDWTLTVDHATHPGEDALLLDVDFEGEGYDLHVVVDPALSAHADHDVARARGDALLAAHDRPADADPVFLYENGDPIDVGMALSSADGFDWTTADVREGDVETALLETGSTDARHAKARGNVVLAGTLSSHDTTLALGFAEDSDDEAALVAADAALDDAFEDVRAAYADSWAAYLDEVAVPDSVVGDDDLLAQYKTAVMVMKAADSKQFPGAGIASPSVPWGDAVDANDPIDYGYNYVWPRDLYQAYTAFDAMGDVQSAIDATEYVYAYQQDDDGFFPQNTFLDGRTRWGGEQMDEIAFPQVMAQQLKARHGYGLDEAGYGYENVRRSSDYVVATGPHTQQERWEEEPGYSPSTTAAEIAGLVCAADLALDAGESADAIAYLGVADHWVDRLEDWHATTTGTEKHTNTPYYVRITDEGNPDDGELRTHNNGGGTLDERNIMDGGFLELVRLGVLPADDETVRNTVTEYDGDIMVETPHGPAWYRYTGDGYGEKRVQPGAPWMPDETGKGRLWPFFTGERGEYELLLDDPTFDPEGLLETLGAFANDGRMLPEQVWDEAGENDFDWAFGSGTSSATPLSWTNAQFVRLAWSIDAGEPVETPAVVRERYGGSTPTDGPNLDVTIDREGDSARVTGHTDGDDLVVKTQTETVHVSGGDVDVTAAAEADARVTVVAASGSLPAAETTIAYERV